MKTGDIFSLVITYITGDGPGVVWLDPEQTAGKDQIDHIRALVKRMGEGRGKMVIWDGQIKNIV